MEPASRQQILQYQIDNSLLWVVFRRFDWGRDLLMWIWNRRYARYLGEFELRRREREYREEQFKKMQPSLFYKVFGQKYE